MIQLQCLMNRRVNCTSSFVVACIVEQQREVREETNGIQRWLICKSELYLWNKPKFVATLLLFNFTKAICRSWASCCFSLSITTNRIHCSTVELLRSSVHEFKTPRQQYFCFHNTTRNSRLTLSTITMNAIWQLRIKPCKFKGQNY